MREPPRINSPLTFAADPTEQNAGTPSKHCAHSPQLGRKTIATASPALRSLTPGPTASTIPAPS